jgi:hypothetical protein
MARSTAMEIARRRFILKVGTPECVSDCADIGTANW